VKETTVKVCPGDKVRLSHIDPAETGGLSKEKAFILLEKTHQKLDKLQQRLYAEKACSLLILFQALDTGGKDGAIRKLCSGFNPAGIRTTAFKVPTQEELDHDFLWRAHKATPAKGMIAVWNRSHYEDVLVARVHKLVPEKIWKARYDQINRFEQILAENGTRIVKFMLHISKDEQTRRIQARIEDPEKQWKLSLADLKERALWPDYVKAYEDAINRCSTDCAPWYVVPANHKWARNLAVARVILRVLKEIDPHYPPVSIDLKTFVVS
jgi:PPK2 family polyphosphate:nucleotide phosphotransferase